MHHADLLPLPLRAHLALERQVYQFGNGQTVHVGAQRHHRARLAAAQDSHDPGLPHRRLHLESELPQVIGNQLLRARLLEAQLGVFMNVTTPRDHLGHDRRQLAFDELGQLRRGGALRVCASAAQQGHRGSGETERRTHDGYTKEGKPADCLKHGARDP